MKLFSTHDNTWNELISRKLDGDLSQEEARALDEHMQTCEACQEKERAYRAMSGLLQGASAIGKNHGEAYEVKSITLTTKQTRFTPFQALVAIAAAMLLAVTVFFTGQKMGLIPFTTQILVNAEATTNITFERGDALGTLFYYQELTEKKVSNQIATNSATNDYPLETYFAMRDGTTSLSSDSDLFYSSIFDTTTE